MTISIKFIIILSLTISSAFAIDDSIVIIQSMSSSGKTIYLDRGVVDDLGDDDYGILLTKEEVDLGKFVFKPVAKLRAVKVLTNQSVWIVYKEYLPNILKVGSKLVLFAESKLLKGRTNLNIKRSSLVTLDDPTNEVKDFLLGGDDLAIKQADYRAIEITHKKNKHLGVDVDLIDIDKWEDRMLDGKLYVDGIYRSPHAKQFSERKRVHTFEKMVVAFLEKYNDPLFNRNSFYKEQERSVDDLPAASVYQRYMEQQDRELRDTAAKEEKFYRDVKERGEAWSEGYSDDELAELLTNLNVTQEKKRRMGIIAYKHDYQAFASFGMNVINNENVNDSDTTEQNKYDFELSLETYFLKRFKNLKRITLEGSVRRSRDAYFGGNLNVKSIEYSMAGHVNWYPFMRASAIDTNIYYFTLLTRYGIARLTNNSAQEAGNYQLFTIPGFRFGLKHNFRNTYGFRLSLGYEDIRAERMERNDDAGSLPDRATYKEGKVAIGLSKFF